MPCDESFGCDYIRQKFVKRLRWHMMSYQVVVSFEVNIVSSVSIMYRKQ